MNEVYKGTYNADERNCDHHPVVSSLLFWMHSVGLRFRMRNLRRRRDGDITQFRLHHFLLIRYNILQVFSKICVAMFVFMTGYGMWVSYESQKKKTTMSNYIKKRMVTLMTGFLIIFCCDRDSCDSNWTFIEVYGHDFVVWSIWSLMH